MKISMVSNIHHSQCIFTNMHIFNLSKLKEYFTIPLKQFNFVYIIINII